jgi:hypothetical protein
MWRARHSWAAVLLVAAGGCAAASAGRASGGFIPCGAVGSKRVIHVSSEVGDGPIASCTVVRAVARQWLLHCQGQSECYSVKLPGHLVSCHFVSRDTVQCLIGHPAGGTVTLILPVPKPVRDALLRRDAVALRRDAVALRRDAVAGAAAVRVAQKQFNVADKKSSEAAYVRTTAVAAGAAKGEFSLTMARLRVDVASSPTGRSAKELLLQAFSVFFDWADDHLQAVREIQEGVGDGGRYLARADAEFRHGTSLHSQGLKLLPKKK